MKVTNSFKAICKLKHPTKVIQGSQGAGKTYSVLQRWLILAATSERKQLCSIISDTLPALRAGAIKDFKDICENEGIPFKGTKTPHVYKVGKWTFEFYSVDKEAKGRGGRRDRIFINEANRMPWSIARALIARTHIERIFDFNPVEKFWAHTNFVDTGECDFVTLTYKDNDFLPVQEKIDIERHAPWGSAPDENYWRVFGLGLVGFVEGQIFKNYKTYKELPKGGTYQDSIGVDFGDVDPMSAVHVNIDHQKRAIYWKELFYASEADIEDMSKAIKGAVSNWHEVPLWCDHEPKIIRMLRGLGHPAYKANKKAGIVADLRAIKQYTLYIHEDSKNLNREVTAYKYQVKNDQIVEYPDQTCDEHGIDAGRYASIKMIA